MARVLVARQPWGILIDQYGNARGGCLASITATVYQNDTDSSEFAAEDYVSNSRGELPGWVEVGAYDQVDDVAGGSTARRVEAVSGALLSGVDERVGFLEAGPGGGGGIAASVTFAPAGGLEATDVQAAIVEVKAASDLVESNAATASANAAAAVLRALPQVIATTTTAGALTAGKTTPVDATAGTKAMTLPTGQADGTVIAVYKYDSNTANPVTITGNIRGVAGTTHTLTDQNETVVYVADSAGSWVPTASHKPRSMLDRLYLTLAGAQTVAGAKRFDAVNLFTVMPEVLSSVGGSVRARSAVDGLTHKWDLSHDGIAGNIFHLTTGPNTLPARSVSDAVTTNGSATVTSATAAFYSGNDRPDQGKLITGPGIPANAMIGSVVNATTVTLVDYTTGLPALATATASGVTVQIGVGNANGCAIAIGVTGGNGILLNNYATGAGLNVVQLATAAAPAVNLQQRAATTVLKGIYTSTGSAPLVTLQGANAVAGTAMEEWRDQNAAPIAGQVMADTGLLAWRRTIQAVAPNSSVTPLIRVADETPSNPTETYLSAKTTGDHGLVNYRWAGAAALMYASKWITSSDRLKLQVGNGAQTKGAETFSTLIEARVNATPQLGLFGAAPVAQQAATADLKTALVNIGLIAAAGSASPLNLEGGTLTCGSVVSSGNLALPNNTAFQVKESGGTARSVAVMSGGNTLLIGDNGSATVQFSGTSLLFAPGGVAKFQLASTGILPTDGVPFIFGTTTGSKLGTATTQKIGFWNATPITQPTRAGALTDSSGGTSGGATIAAVTDTATAANAIATLAAKYNALEAKLSAAAGGCGITA